MAGGSGRNATVGRMAEGSGRNATVGRMAEGSGRNATVGGLVAAAQEHGQDVADEMVHADEWLARSPSDPLCSLQSDEERTDQPGPMGDGDAVDVRDRHSSLRESRPNDGADASQMIARGQLGNDASVGCVKLDLRVDDIGQDAAAVVHDRSGGFVTRRFNA
jgi:hypothetical protein